jgi:hypothetical protein
LDDSADKSLHTEVLRSKSSSFFFGFFIHPVDTFGYHGREFLHKGDIEIFLVSQREKTNIADKENKKSAGHAL